MKIMKYYGFLPLLLMAFVSCNMEDKGNYDYIAADDFFPVKINKIAFEKEIKELEFIPQEPAYYDPIFELMDDYDKYTYTWYATYRGTSGRVERAEVANTRILDMEHFPLNAGDYTLYFEIKEPVNNLQRLYNAQISVAASKIGSYGVYVMKNVNGNTELDYFKFDNAKVTDNVVFYPNLVSGVFDRSLSGKPVGMERYASTYYWETVKEDGSPVTNMIPTGCWYFFSENDIVATTTDFTMTYKGSERMFYVMPNAIKPQRVAPLRNMLFYFMSDNQVYGVYTMAQGIGRFGMANRAGGIRASSVGMLAGSWYTMIYDELSGEFLYAYAIDGSLTSANAQIKEMTVLKNKEVIVNKLVEPIAIMEGGGLVPDVSGQYMQGSMILKHKTQPNTFYLTQSKANGGVPFTWIRPIDPAADIVKVPTPVMSSSYYGNAIYYAKNSNELWYYVDGGDTDTPAPIAQRQIKVATLGAGETIVKIAPSTWNNTAPAQAAYHYSWITVLVNTADGHYKFYAFDNNRSTAELNPVPVLVLEGEGEAVTQYMHFQRQTK